MLLLVKMVDIAAGVEMRKYYLGFTSAQFFYQPINAYF